jgi:glycerol uptake facilitator-like aquaporin
MFTMADAAQIFVAAAQTFASLLLQLPLVVRITALTLSLKPDHTQSWVQEFTGTILLIFGTASAGTWWGSGSTAVTYACHGFGILLANKISGGAQVNPAVSVAVCITGRQSYAETVARITGQICGGLTAWNAASIIATALALPAFKGPEYGGHSLSLTIFHEMLATLCLCLAIFILNFGIEPIQF